MRRLALAVALAACDPTPTPPTPTPPETAEGAASSVVPQPRTAEPIASAATAAPSGSAATAPRAAPEPLSATEPLAVELAPPPKTELAGLDLEARWLWPLRHEMTGVEPRGAGAVDVEVQLLASGRMRWKFRGGAVSLPPGTELLARADRYGQLLVWPDRPEYRVLAPGTLRAVLDERRLDATPLSKATRAELGEGKRLGVSVRRVELTGGYGTVTLELARLKEAGLGAAVLCRMLVELGGIEPAAAPCQTEPEAEVPLAASYAWGARDGKEALRLEATRFVLHEKDAAPVLVPATGQRARGDGLPGTSTATLASEDELAGLGGKDTGGKAAPRAGLTARNRGDRQMFLLLNGFPVAYVGPRGRVRLEGLRAVKHRLEWRSFLADEATAPTEVQPEAEVRHPADADGDDDER